MEYTRLVSLTRDCYSYQFSITKAETSHTYSRLGVRLNWRNAFHPISNGPASYPSLLLVRSDPKLCAVLLFAYINKGQVWDAVSDDCEGVMIQTCRFCKR